MKIKGTLMETIKRTQLRLFVHMKIMTDNSLLKKMPEWMSEGGRKMGRPKLTWTHSIAQKI